MIGSGSMRDRLRELSVSLGVARRVRWHGAVPDAARFLRAFDVLCITSWTEGTPMVLLEAMAAGVPIVSTAVGGIPDVVSSREALLVQPGDPQSIARGVREVLAKPADALERADAARKRLSSGFAVEPWVRRYRAIYRSCQRG
jgi:glycosyltransferase involved in cell wall biosynthesis